MASLGASGQQYSFVTIAGSPGSSGHADGTGGAARFSNPTGGAINKAGDLYIADTDDQTIRKIAPGGVVTTFAGSSGVVGSTNGYGTARFNHPLGLAVCPAGNVFVGDSGNNLIRRIGTDGGVTILAGLAGVSGSDDGTWAIAKFNVPWGIAIEQAGLHRYVSDYANSTIRIVTREGDVTTMAGTAGELGNADGVGPAARFNHPEGIAVDGSGNFYVADSDNNAIRKIAPDGTVSTLAGGGPLQRGSADGIGTSARFNSPAGVAVDGQGNVFVTDRGNNTIRRITPAGEVTTIGGAAGVIGSQDGPGTTALFNFPTGIVVDGNGSLFIIDTWNQTIRQGVPSAATAPLITNQPVSQTVTAGNSVTFSATASGTPAPTFQWQKNDVDISGATSSSYTIASVAAGDAATYRVIATNSAGSATSNASTLTINVVAGVPCSVTCDFNDDGQTDIVWSNSRTGERRLWLMNGIQSGLTPASVVNLGVVTPDWEIAGTGDFNRDNQADILWQNAITGQRALWLMNGIAGGFTPASIVNLGYVTTDWAIAGTGDFNDDGQTDILWQNAVTGQRALWLMNGAQGGFTPASIVNLGFVDTNWAIAGAGDLDGDGRTDILWQNAVTGQRALWLMNGITGGFTPAGIVNLGYVTTDWVIAGTGDSNGDRQTDIHWQNSVTGQRALWLMNGFTPASIVNLGFVPTDWEIIN